MTTPKFVLDGSLGKLAVFLRILGYDTILSQKSLLEVAEETLQGRYILTSSTRIRDQLSERNKGRYKEQIILLPQTNHVEQLHQLFLLEIIALSPPEDLEQARCSKCNGLLKRVSKEQVQNKVQQETFKHITEFYECEDCKQVYWIGSHWRRIRRILNQAKQIAN